MAKVAPEPEDQSSGDGSFPDLRKFADLDEEGQEKRNFTKLDAETRATRKCTDVPCLGVFTIHVILFWVCTMVGVEHGNPWRLNRPRDFRGGYCGIERQVGDLPAMLDQNMRVLSLDVSASVDPIARQIVCASTTRAAVAASGAASAAELTSACEGVPDQEVNSTNIIESLRCFTNPDTATLMYASSDNPVGINILEDVDTYTHDVCAPHCIMNQTYVARTYIYTPAPDTSWLPAWTAFRAYAVSVGGDDARMLSGFYFPAWPVGACPYEERFCVPLPGVAFYEGPRDLCKPRVADAVAADVGEEFAALLNSMVLFSVAERTVQTFGSSVGDAERTWDTFFIVAVMAVVAGIVLLVMMRFLVKPIVLASIIAVFMMMVIGGVCAVVRSSQCADAGFVDAATSSANSAQSQAASAAAAGLNASALPSLNATGDCADAGGFMIESEISRRMLSRCGFVMFGCSFLWFIFIACFCKQIMLAININKVAARFVHNTPNILIVPLVQVFLSVLWVLCWLFMAAWVMSQVRSDTVPSNPFSAAEAAEDDVCGGAGFVYRDEENCEIVAGAAVKCFRCFPKRFFIDFRFVYQFFSYFWVQGILIALGQTVVAGAAGEWFFAPRKQKSTVFPCVRSLRSAVRCHLGSLAFGALILTSGQLLKWTVYFLSFKPCIKKRDHAVLKLLCMCTCCCVIAFDKHLRYISRHAFVQIALKGDGFCESAKSSMSLLIRVSKPPFDMMGVLGIYMRVVGTFAITTGTAIMGYLSLQILYPEVDPVVPCVVYILMGFVVAELFMNVFGIAVDTTVQCFFSTLERNLVQKDEKGNILDKSLDFVPEELRSFVKSTEGGDMGCIFRLPRRKKQEKQEE